MKKAIKYLIYKLTYVLYLKKEGKFIESPSFQQYPTGQDIHRFQFGVIKLWEIPTLRLKNLGLKGLLPLLPLTREGKDRAVIEDVITELSAHKSQSETDLLSLAYGLASLVFRSENDHNWLKRRFSMLDELLNESWAFQEILQKGLEKGLQQGLQEGLQKGLEKGLQQSQEKALKQGQEEGLEKALEASRRTLITLVEYRYSSLAQRAREKANLTSDLDALQNLILRVSLSTTEAEVRESLK